MRIAHAIAEIDSDVGIERELALLDELHRSQGGHELRDRGDAIKRVRVRRLVAAGCWRVDEAPAELALIRDLAVAYRDHREARERVFRIARDRAQLGIERRGEWCARVHEHVEERGRLRIGSSVEASGSILHLEGDEAVARGAIQLAVDRHAEPILRASLL